MRFKSNYTVIIKFTQNDNVCASGQQHGWVDYFAILFKESVKYQIEADIEIIFKNETEAISAADFESSDYIFYILSPAFIYSSNINQDASTFETAFSFDIPYINNKVKKIFKAPVNIEEMPLSLSTPTYYRFYDYSLINESEYETYEGWNEFQDNSDFWNVFADVVTDAITNFNTDKEPTSANLFISGKDRTYENERNIIKRELKAFNAKIFPDEDFSIESNYMEDPELHFMEKCDMAIHFPDEFLRLSKEKRKSAFEKASKLRRFIWFNPLQALKPEKKVSYNELKIELKPYNNIEVVESPIEEFKEIIREKLFSEKSALDNNIETDPKQLIYMISDNDELVEELNKSLHKKLTNHKIEINTKSSSVGEYRNRHNKLLTSAVGFIVLYSGDNKNWLNSVTAEIKKAPGLKNSTKQLNKNIVKMANQQIPDNIAMTFNIIQKSDSAEISKEIKNLFEN